MKVDVLTETVIARPRFEVAVFASNPDNAPIWYVNIKAVEWQSEHAVRVGARAAFVAHFLGKRMAYTYEIVEFVTNERLVMRTSEGPFPMETTYTWGSTEQGGTRMTLRNRGEPKGFSRFLAPFLSLAMRRANAKDLARLKAILENRAPIPSASAGCRPTRQPSGRARAAQNCKGQWPRAAGFHVGRHQGLRRSVSEALTAS